LKVSWQVNGVRDDPYAKANPIVVEEEKTPEEKGSFLHPALHGKSKGRIVHWARKPEIETD